MADKIYSTKLQDRTERNIFIMVGLLMVVLSVGGLVEIVPLFYLKDTMEHNKNPQIVWQRAEGQSLDAWKAGDGVRPYKPLEFAGHDIYVSEGCYTCHSQMIRPFRDEKERYGHYSLASESMYDHPFQWGSKRTGPDLARLGGKYSDEWHIQHLLAPRSVVPESVMPNYPFLANKNVNVTAVKAGMKVVQTLGVPYTDADIASADAIEGKTELQAVVAYLQVLGTMVTLDEGVDYRE
jgi:cytochrome c oxidase cbb3-type subunit 2